MAIEMLPNVENAVVEESKILDYLLSETHPEGASKARFFQSLGFERGSWQTLAFALVRLASENNVSEVKGNPFGTKYVVDGQFEGPQGIKAWIRTVWIVESTQAPRLVTAHPIKRNER